MNTKHMHVKGMERLKAAIGYVPTQAEREQRSRELYLRSEDLDLDAQGDALAFTERAPETEGQ